MKFVHLLTLLALSAPLSPVLGQSASAPAKISEKPYAPLMVFGPSPFDKPATKEQIEHIAKTWQFVNTVPLEIEKAVREINPEFISSKYCNGSYVQLEHEAPQVEAGLPLAIACWKTECKLLKALDETATTVLLSPPAKRPEDTPAIYPWKESISDEEFSATNAKYVTWLRLGDEILRIDKAKALEDGTIELTVKRGIWKTEAAAHDTDTIVLQPVYIGSIREGYDSNLSGIPGAKVPHKRLRYALQVKDPLFHKWLGDKCEAIFKEGYRVVWLDITSSNFFNNGDAYGRTVTPWDISEGKQLDHSAQREYQQMKLDYLLKRFPEGRFVINNVHENAYWEKGEERRFLTGEKGHLPVSGGCVENFGETKDIEEWTKTVDMTIDMSKNNFWVMALSKGMGLDKAKRPEYRRFAYATYLLARNPGDRVLFGAFWDEGPLEQPAKYFYYDLGKPEQQFEKAAEAEDQEVKGLYARKFEKGLVLVNASEKELAKKIDQPMVDPETQETLEEISIPAWSARILIK